MSTVLVAKQEQRKLRILNAAEQMFRREGFHKLSLNELVSTIRISKSTIYDLFGSKEGLIAALADRLSDHFDDCLKKISSDKSRSVESRMLAIAEFQGDIARELNSRFIEDLKLYTPVLWEKYRERRNYRLANHYSGLIQEGMDSGLFNNRYSKEFLLQLYLKMSDLVSGTDIMDYISMTQKEAYELIFSVYLRGTK